MSVNSPSRNLNLTGGFSLIEVLVALLVLSIGLVGLAALQLTSLQRAQSSLHTSLATAAALDFEERAWIHLAGRESPRCLGPTELATIAVAVKAQWGSSAPSTKASIPGLDVEVIRGTPSPTIDPAFVPVTLTMDWTDSRVQGGMVESFEYRFQALCRPDGVDEDDEDEEEEVT